MWRKTGLRRHQFYVMELHALRAGRFMFLLALVWGLSYAAWREFPYVRPGAAVVYAAKEDLESSGRVFPLSVPPSQRLAVVGNSKVLTGFIPAAFDAQVHALTGIPVYSANLGKPDETHFVKDLEVLARNHQLPGTILITLPWAIDDAVHSDDAIMDRLFPFRRLPRDLILFSLLARSRGGVANFYREGASVVGKMQRDRGWYFIAGQSHHPGNRLPDGFHLATDRPAAVDDPAFHPRGPEFTRLNALAELRGLRLIIVPSYHREGELAASPEHADAVAARMKGFPRFTVAGPDYFLLPDKYFSDPVHLNPDGARLYTGKLAEIVARVL